MLTRGQQVVSARSHYMREDVRLKSDIYKLKCNDCDAIYIDQTKRNVGIRTKEHIRAWQLNQPEKSNFAKHLIENKHNFNIQDLDILHLVNEPRKRIFYLEAYEIQSAVKKGCNFLNEQLDLVESQIIKIMVNGFSLSS